MLERKEIEQKLPHRDTALLLDRFETTQTDEGTVGIGYLTITPEHCIGHFPGNPIMRGVDRIEIIALTLGMLALTELPEGKVPYLARVGLSRFPGTVVAGDLVRTEVKITRVTAKRMEGNGKAYVGDRLVGEVEGILCVIGDAPSPNQHI